MQDEATNRICVNMDDGKGGYEDSRRLYGNHYTRDKE